MFLDGPESIQKWLTGHFPDFQWTVTESALFDPCVRVDASWGTTILFSGFVGKNCHTEFLDELIERTIEIPNANWHNLPANWKGEYVEYRSPERIL